MALSNPTDEQKQIIRELQHGDRDPVSDADDVITSGLDWVGFVHSGDDGTSITLTFNYGDAAASGHGHHEEFDIFEAEA